MPPGAANHIRASSLLHPLWGVMGWFWNPTSHLYMINLSNLVSLMKPVMGFGNRRKGGLLLDSSSYLLGGKIHSKHLQMSTSFRAMLVWWHWFNSGRGYHRRKWMGCCLHYWNQQTSSAWTWNQRPCAQKRQQKAQFSSTELDRVHSMYPWTLTYM